MRVPSEALVLWSVASVFWYQVSPAVFVPHDDDKMMFESTSEMFGCEPAVFARCITEVKMLLLLSEQEHQGHARLLDFLGNPQLMLLDICRGFGKRSRQNWQAFAAGKSPAHKYHKKSSCVIYF